VDAPVIPNLIALGTCRRTGRADFHYDPLCSWGTSLFDNSTRGLMAAWRTLTSNQSRYARHESKLKALLWPMALRNADELRKPIGSTKTCLLRQKCKNLSRHDGDIFALSANAPKNHVVTLWLPFALISSKEGVYPASHPIKG
jgi:hypothetical protein